MPLLNRKPFSTDPPPSDLDENEKIFICRQTNEVYRDYESFFKRTILCNSLVWSCGITLKHGLTYEEALESEKETKKAVQLVPIPIQQGVLTLVHYTRHSRLDNLCDEVYNYIRDRYQEGEEVVVKYKGEKFAGHIHKVIEPSPLANGFGSNISSPTSKQKIGSPRIKNKSGRNSNVSSPNKPGGNLIVLSDNENQSENKVKKSALPSPSSAEPTSTWPDSKYYQYEVKIKSKKKLKDEIPEFITVKYSEISRKKGSFSRDKLKLLLRLSCCRSTSFSEDGYWKVKDEYRKKFDLSADIDVTFENMPIKKRSKKRKSDAFSEMNGKGDLKKRKKGDEKDQKQKEDKNKKLKDKSKKEKSLKKMSPEEIEKLKLEMKIKREKEKEKRKQERDVEREVKKKERDKARQEKQVVLKEQRLFLLHWCVPQDDLDLDNLKELPTPVPLQCKFSVDMFGNIVMLLEFLHTFGEFFDMKQDFPDGVSLEMLEEALQEHDAEGIFYDILKFLLQCILKTHAEEEEEEGLDDSDVQETERKEEEEEEDSDLTRLKKAVSSSASMAAAWAQLYQGLNLHELTLDPFTCSEILRLHILSSGARLVSGTDGDPYRWQRRGGFTLADDAGVAFRHREHNIMRVLVTSNIYDLDAADKLKILSTLCSQLLTYVTTRDIIDDGFDRLKKAKRECQEEQWADQRKDKEEAAAKYRKRMEEKAREREEKEKKLAESKSESPDSKEEIVKQDSSKPEGDHEMSNEEDPAKTITRSQGPCTAEEPMADEENQEQLEREERKERLRKKEKVFFKEIRKSEAMSGLQPLGIDRGFRRYWLFNSINGLFIEDNDSELSKLLQPKVIDELSEDDEEYGSDGDSSVSESLVDNLSTMSGEVGSLLNPKLEDTNKTPKNCSLTKEQIQEEKELARVLKLYNVPLESLPENCPLTLRAESGEKREENCERLTRRNITQWSYLDKKEDFDELLSALNPRGFRERSLREALVQNYETILNGLQDNPMRMENHERKHALQEQIAARKKRTGLRNQPPAGVDKTLYKSMEDFIEANLRDQILDLEDRIWQGGLGSVKTEDIAAWRKKVENGIYDFIPAADASAAENKDFPVNGVDVDGSESEKMEVDERKEAESTVHEDNLKACKLNILPCLENSRPGTPVDSSFASTPTTSHTPQAINPCVRSLARAVLEVEKGIERKYLIPPLGDDDETKKRKVQEASDAAKMEFDEMMAGKKKKEKIVKNDIAEGEKQENAEQVAKPQKTLLERWEDSLMASTNLSQVFIHLTSLDNCISWVKSVLNARCRICRRKGDAEHMLLCDGCDRGHHMYCLKPPIKEIPEGDWFCSTCRPKEPRRSFRKTRKVEESDEESGDEDRTRGNRQEVEESNSDEDDSSEEEDSEDETVLDDDDDEDEDEDEEEESEEVEESNEEGSVHMETCACCDGGGELLCCETCSLAYHLECAYPPLRRVPRGNWACQVCTGANGDLPTGRKIKKSVIKAAEKIVNESNISRKPTKVATKTPAKKIVTKNVVKTPAPLKLKTSQSRSATPSPAVTTSQGRKTKTPAVRVNGGKVVTPPQTPKTPTTTSKTPTATSKTPAATSKTPTTQSNSAPKLRATNSKWPGQVKTCRKLLKEMTDHEDSWPFLYPVDETEVPDYSAIIETPMDLASIERKLTSRQYHSVEEFAVDVRQIFFNCAEYNKPRTREARAGIRLSALFETRIGELGLDASEKSRPLRTRRSR